MAGVLSGIRVIDFGRWIAGPLSSLPGFAADDPRAARPAWLVNGAAAGGRPADPWSGVYECRDGVMALLNLATPRFVRRFLEATGTLEEWTTKGYLEPDRLVPDSELWSQQRDDLSALLRTRTAEEWDRLATQVLFPLTRIRTSAAHRDRAAQGKGKACCRLPLIVEDTSQEDKAYEMVSLSGRANH